MVPFVHDGPKKQKTDIQKQKKRKSQSQISKKQMIGRRYDIGKGRYEKQKHNDTVEDGKNANQGVYKCD